MILNLRHLDIILKFVYCTRYLAKFCELSEYVITKNVSTSITKSFSTKFLAGTHLIVKVETFVNCLFSYSRFESTQTTKNITHDRSTKSYASTFTCQVFHNSASILFALFRPDFNVFSAKTYFISFKSILHSFEFYSHQYFFCP